MAAPAVDTVEIIADAVPEEIWDALYADARERNVSRNEAAVSILAERYKVRRLPSGVKFREPRTDPNYNRPLQLVVPEKLRDKLHEQMWRRKATMRGLVCEALAEHYGLPFDSPQRRPRVVAA